MKILGVNLGKNQDDKGLRDGGACIIVDNKIAVAVAEERVTRNKTCGGFINSMRYCLDYLQMNMADLDAVVVSSCLDPIRSDKAAWGFCEIDVSKIQYVPHHISHAYSAFAISPFDEALVIVLDSGGNLLEDGVVDLKQWWAYEREQNSYYIGRGNRVTLLDRDFSEPYAVGFGEAYRAFTYYLGWHSYMYSGKTMALSTYGDPERFKDVELFTVKGDNLFSLMRNDPLDPVGMIQQFAQQVGIDFGVPRHPDAPLEDIHRDIAYMIQDRMEKALLQKVTSLSKRTGIKNLCLAGGVALNCVVNSKILSSTPIEKLFIVPAAGDTGQSLGNALYGHHIVLHQDSRVEQFSPYLGREYPDCKKAVSDWIHSSLVDWECVERDDYVQEVAKMIAQGSIVGWFSGRSEFGPRALGARSILADARYFSVKKRLMEIKEREDFMPFAPAILREHACEYFNPPTDSPYMLLTADVKSYKKKLIPGALHADTNGRLQTVSHTDHEKLYDLLEKYKEITGIPILINTSFNKKGSPIVESPHDALEAFRIMDIDALVLNSIILKKRDMRRNTEEIMSSRDGYILSTDKLKRKEYDLSVFIITQLADYLRKDFLGYQLIPKKGLTLFDEYITLLKQGKKGTTIRYRWNGLHYPSELVLPLMNTGPHGIRDQHPEHVGDVAVVYYTVKPFAWLNGEDAKKDGFDSEESLKCNLQRIYGPIEANAYVSIYTVKLV